MTGCNATLVTATTRLCGAPVPVPDPAGRAVRCGAGHTLCDGHTAVDLHVVRCTEPPGRHVLGGHINDPGTCEWTDDLPGAIPHQDGA